MKQSTLFTKTRREAPKDEVAKNAELLIRAGYINKEMSGVYDYLPLGLRTLNKIMGIIREEMNGIGGQEVFLSALQDKSLWQTTGRWDDAVVDNWFKTKLKAGGELGLSFTHEEPLTALMKSHISSFRDLPIAVYQFQTKFRNEERAKSGIMRGREFLMKDLYSFNTDEKTHAEFYDKTKWAYTRVFERLGIGEKTYWTYASGGSFSKYSLEFQTVCEAGEDTIFIPDGYEHGKKLALNKEVFTDEVKKDLGLEQNGFKEAKAVEVGNIFTLGTKFSEPLELVYTDAEGKSHPVFMGSYGIGPSRLMGAIAELLADEKGLIWPKAIAPFTLHLIELKSKNNAEVGKRAAQIYEAVTKAGGEVLWDDRDISAGEKFADSDLLGIPERLVVSEKTLQSGQFELKNRASGEVSMITNYAGTIL